ncbi:hypothetical protein P9597_10670 [Aneurinibacillus migulanus]|uniref:hypothetical protein n=1 Tax=Aneurinibacillus migulanus TaxID=47500 RepID=UPI002E1CDEE4|nr:hypothetical protein [Aneurinibacillus migulanus]
MRLTEKSREICNQFYKNKCGMCPIRPECVASIGGGQEAFERWQQNVNRAAGRYISKSNEGRVESLC